jgi:sugar lactone lactonase YvrE
MLTPVHRALVAGFALAVLTALPLLATPGFWHAATQADFLRGDVEHLSIDEHGRLMLGPEARRLYEAGVPFVWTMLASPDQSVFIGTGNEGKVMRVDRAGAGTLFFDSGEMEVHALANAPHGGLYVGTSPDGRVYRLDAKGQGASFFDPEDKYIWSMVTDAKGLLYIATGDKGVVYRVTPDGKGTPFFSTKTTHAISLALDPSGQLLVGTGSPGRVFRVDPEGKGFLLLDTSHQEIKSLRVDPKGTIYVAAQTGRPAQGGDTTPFAAPVETPPPAPVPQVSTEITAIAVIDLPVTAQPAAAPPPRADSRNPTGAIYRILPDGLWDQLWESRDDAPYDIAFDTDGSLIIATGGNGKIFRLSGDPMRPTLLTSVTAQQATMIHRAANRTLVTTANPGQLLALSAGRSERGTYDSEIKDARMVATWGTISWRATTPSGTQVEVRTRSGNTRTPDDAWSPWSAPYSNPSGSSIASPKARYLQWRAVLSGKGDSPVLTSVTAAYLQRNVRPEVESVTVHQPGVVFQKPFSTGEAEIAGFDDDPVEKRLSGSTNGGGQPAAAPALGRRTYEKGLQTFVWKASDENGDELSFDVLYRREGETTWKTLKAGITDSILVWDTATAPNGSYVVKIVASDSRSNAADAALKGERESNGFDVDNSPPAVTLGVSRREGGSIVIPVEIRDTDSAITRVEYSIDAQRWQSAFPQDGILDGRQEQFLLRFDPAVAGRTLVVRATDTMNNVGSGEALIK